MMIDGQTIDSDGPRAAMTPKYPHCDPRVLHAPGSCEYCDIHPEWQALRASWGICFTGKAEAGKLPCPAELARPKETIDRWPGNLAMLPSIAVDANGNESAPAAVQPVDRSARAVVGQATSSGEADITLGANGQQRGYVVLSDEERRRGFVRPVRVSYRHLICGAITSMGRELAETYARDPAFYSGTFCATCRTHRPVGAAGEFVWAGTDEKVGT